MRDVIIIGGGPAGLSAALILGRCRRDVLVYDEGKPRNARSVGVHGFLGNDGIAPAELRAVARRQLAPYEVEVRDVRVTEAARVDGGFEVTDAHGLREKARKLVVATGVVDVLPRIEGVDELYGRGVYSCAYCDGWEMRGRRLGVYAEDGSVDSALALLTWSGDVILFTGGAAVPDAADAARLARHGVAIRCEPVERFEGSGQGLEHVVMAGGERVAREALFLHLGQRQSSPLLEGLGCRFESDSVVETSGKQRTSVEGVYLAGDACHDVKLAIVAAADGARAAYDVNQRLREEDTA